jgi:hypothetical protein
MPFENVHGNGGLLTTVEDLLRFTRNLETGEVGGSRFVEEMHRRSALNSGQVHAYAGGLQIRTYRGLPIVEHSGSTAGYRGHLTRFPVQGLAVAVVCNNTQGNAGGRLREVADLYLAEFLEEGSGPPEPQFEMSAAALERFAGRYRDMRRETLVRLAAVDGGLRMGGNLLMPVAENRFEGGGSVLEFDTAPFLDGRPAAVLNTSGAHGVRVEPVADFDPSEGDLAEYTGTYRSDEAEATYTVEVENGTFVMKDRWGQGRLLQPLYPDAFGSGGNTLIFRRDSAGRIVEMSLSQGRVWDLRFRKVG